MTLLRVKERITGPRGLFDVQNEWYGFRDEFRFTIGLAGLMGFGVGCCRPELLPADIRPLSPGTLDRFHPHYGNYLHVPSASILCFIPAHFLDILSPGTTAAPFYGSRISISNTSSGTAVLARMFRDNGTNLAGVFIDKYHSSCLVPNGSGLPNTADGTPGGALLSGGICGSRPLMRPINPLELPNCNSAALGGSGLTPAATNDGCWRAAQSRGPTFLPLPIWAHAQMAFLSLAHAQALLGTDGTPTARARAAAAWMDVSPYAPKGNNSGALGADFNKPSLSFIREDIQGNLGGLSPNSDVAAGRAFTGAALVSSIPAVAQTTHNGQLSGIVDFGHNCVELTPGLVNTQATTANQSSLRVLADSVGWGTISSNSAIVASTLLSLAAESSPGADDGIWWAGTSSFEMNASTGGSFHGGLSSQSATRRAMSSLGLPRAAGTAEIGAGGALNIFGNDEILLGLGFGTANTMFSRRGGTSGGFTGSGAFRLNLFDNSDGSVAFSGMRTCRLVTP